MNSLVIVLAFYSVSCAEQEPGDYNDYQVWRTQLSQAADIALIKKLEEDQDISVWSLLPYQADYMVKPENRLKVDQLLTGQNLNHTVLILNVQRRIDETTPCASVDWSEKALRHGHRLNWHTYPTLEIINEYLDHLKESYDSIAKVFIAGYSVENRTIRMVRVSNGNPKNIPMLITAGLHSREWVSITSALYILNNVVTKFDKQPDFMKNIDWYILPLVNPDGYDYTVKRDRLWRKNRRKVNACYGVDINRNFALVSPNHDIVKHGILNQAEAMFNKLLMNIQRINEQINSPLSINNKEWNVGGVTTHNACSPIYCGSFPFSEPESSAVRDVLNIINSIKTPGAYVDLHTYGQFILFPWSHTKKKANNYNYLSSTASKMSQSIYNTSNLKFTYGTPPEIIYAASGTSMDWVYSMGVQLTYAIEGRDKGAHGFLTLKEDIEIAGKEMLAAVSTLARDISPSTLKTGRLHEWL